MTARWTLIRAAAGTGKTTALVQHYLALLRDGCDAPSMVAITFTRKAAGELVERVSDVLWSTLLEEHGDTRPQARAARQRLGDDYALYAEHAPQDRAAVERALASLGGAPIGTIDSFVQWLLSEMPLDAAYPLPDGRSVPLDAPLGTGGDPGPVLEEAARATLQQWGEADDPRLARLTRAYTLSDLRTLAVQEPSVESPTATAEVLRALSRSLVETLASNNRGAGLKPAVREALALVVPGRELALQYAEKIGVDRYSVESASLAQWFDDGGEPPDVLAKIWPLLSAKRPEMAPYRWPRSAGRDLASAMGEAGLLDVSDAFRAAISKRAKGIDEDKLAKASSGASPEAIREATEWLNNPQGDPPRTLAEVADNFDGRTDLRKALREVVASLSYSADTLIASLREDGQKPHRQLDALLTIRVPEDLLLQVVQKKLSVATRPVAPALIAWLKGPDSQPSPVLPVALAGLTFAAPKHASNRLWPQRSPGQGQPTPPALRAVVAGGLVRLPLGSLKGLLPGAFANPDTWPDLDALRAAVHDLQRATWQAGLAAAAQQGALDYGALLIAARALCEAAAVDPHHRLHDRFQALLVDEAQDSSPAQFDFYAALLAACPSAKAVAVGDIRQSIYGFRDAEPQGLLQLDGQTDDRLKNYRSVPPLVAAHRALFGPALAAALEPRGLANVQDLSKLTAGRSGSESAERPLYVLTGAPFAGHDAPDPAPKDKDLNAAALRSFCEHLRARWADGGQTFAAVLAPTWRIAKRACALLRAWLGPDEAGRPRVWLESGREWRTGRVVRDLRILLTALLDRSQHLAWVGLWKHPMVGLSDRALALASRNEGLLPVGEGELDPWLGQPGWMVDLSGLTAPHDPRDIAAFDRARGPLQDALSALPRQGAAATLEALATALDWRTVLAASPDPDAVAHLDLALDWLRDLEASGVAVREMVELLGTEDDPPRLNLSRPVPAVSCMTVFGAKGLAWDHVLVASIGGHASSASAKPLSVDIAGQTCRLLPLKLDPNGALDPVADPHSALSSLIQRQRLNEECVRLAYVGLTRARQTAWCALPATATNDVVSALVTAWGPPDPEASLDQAPDGVTWLPYARAPKADRPPPRRVVAADTPLPPAPVAPEPWRLRAPSSLHRHASPTRRTALVERVLDQVVGAGTHHAGLDDHLDSPARFEEPAAARALGDIAHAWLADWRFDPTLPSIERAARFLREDWDVEDDETAAWLVTLASRLLQDDDNPLLARVRGDSVQRFAEWPLLGPATLGGRDRLLLNGTADLVLRDPSAPPACRWTILDFKAGKAPDLSGDVNRAAVTDSASLKTYAPQLEGYREALQAAIQTRPSWAGEGVGAVGLWFVRRGAALWWETDPHQDSIQEAPSWAN